MMIYLTVIIVHILILLIDLTGQKKEGPSTMRAIFQIKLTYFLPGFPKNNVYFSVVYLHYLQYDK